jgi:hypothetical protein
LAAKFTECAWIVALLVPVIIVLMLRVHRHYARVCRETAPAEEFLRDDLQPPVVVVPIDTWTSFAQKALRLALTISDEVEIVHVEYEGAEPLARDWKQDAQEQARAAGRTPPRLVVLRSPFRFVVQPILDHVLEVERSHPGRTVAVVIATLVERHWYHYFLHNQRSELLSALLLVKGDRRITIVNVPWYLET